MLASDAERVCELVKEHFSKATVADAQLVWDQVKGYGLADAEHAIQTHRIERGANAYRPDIARIRVLAAARFRERNPTRDNRTIWEAVCRGRYPGQNRIADLMAHFGGAWDEVKTSGCDDAGKQGVRALILHSARMAFRQEQMSDDEAEASARDVVELQPGERIAPGLSAIVAKALPEVPKPANSSAAKAKALRVLGGGLPPVNPPAPRPPATVAAALDFDDEPQHAHGS